MEPAAALDQLGVALRERLLAEAGVDGGGDLEGRIRALVEREAALLDVAAREELVARVAERSLTATTLVAAIERDRARRQHRLRSSGRRRSRPHRRYTETAVTKLFGEWRIVLAGR